ncbi:hypothetical protein [Desulfovibrio inopinatus]|uniref:hypothetical protein n=1 Tax=Desulfovibrio inopinatus TaxID=102109 RepID=UPI0004046006|nr:hypothetical protein [Desulfovibrio inopinatus]
MNEEALSTVEDIVGLGNTILAVGVVLSALFTILKLTGKIRWSWMLVFFPIWGPILLSILFAFLLPFFMDTGAGSLTLRN